MSSTPTEPEPRDGHEDMGTWDGLMPKGGTWVGRVMRSQRRRDDKADERVERAYHMQIRFMGVLIVLLVVAVLVLAGHAVGLDIPGVGSFTGGGP